MATETVNQPDSRAIHAGTPLPDFLTEERIELALAASSDAATVTRAARRELHQLNATKTETEAVLLALLMRVLELVGVTYAAIGDRDAQVEHLRRELEGEIR